MKKRIAIIAFIAIIGFLIIGCSGDPKDSGEDDPIPGSGTFAGKDVLGNSYSLSVGNDARAAARGDRFNMNVKARDGKIRTVTGKVTNISEDGTLVLETDTGEEFCAVVDDNNNLTSVAGIGDEMPKLPFTGDPLGDGTTTLTPRTFDKVYMRASRWEINADGGGRGEIWSIGKSVLLKDFPTNVSTLQKDDKGRYTITISGTSDIDVDYPTFQIQGFGENDEYYWIAGQYLQTQIKANVPFNITEKINIPETVNLMDYEIVWAFSNVLWETWDNNPDWNFDHGLTLNGIEPGTIMATVSNFSISLKDTSREKFYGNMDDFNYGYQGDGTANYKLAVWKLTADNIADAKKPGAKFEFIMSALKDYEVDLEKINLILTFVWQSPDLGLWWQDEYQITGWVDKDGNNNKVYETCDGVEWDPGRKSIRIDLAEVNKSNDFKNANEINFIIGYWWKDGDTKCIDELAISGANVAAPTPIAGNMGDWYYGIGHDSISLQYAKALWHLSEATLEKAQTSGAKLEIVFGSGGKPNDLLLVFVWVGVLNDSWKDWPTIEEAGENDKNIIIVDGSECKNTTSYDQAAKKLTVPLETGLQGYNNFKNATYVNLILDVWRGVDKFDELGIVSINIVN